jgi:CheY-like chemotaxis protein
MASEKRAKLVLVAEDAEPDFFCLQRAFKLAGYNHELVHVRNGGDAVKYLEGSPPFDDRVRHPLPSLVIIDAKMPGGSGMDVLNAAKQRRYTVPIVMLSGSGLPNDIQAALASGAAEYLRKPSEIADLIVLAQTIHHRWLA